MLTLRRSCGPRWYHPLLLFHPKHIPHTSTASFQGQLFVFRNTETRGEPKLKTTQTLFHLNALRRRDRVTHYLGQKGPPMLVSMKGWFAVDVAVYCTVC